MEELFLLFVPSLLLYDLHSSDAEFQNINC